MLFVLYGMDRAVQNIMFEGKFRRRELILELQRADIILAAREKRDKEREADSMLIHRSVFCFENFRCSLIHCQYLSPIYLHFAREQKIKREVAIKETTVDTVAGIVSTNIFSNLSQEKVPLIYLINIF